MSPALKLLLETRIPLVASKMRPAILMDLVETERRLAILEARLEALCARLGVGAAPKAAEPPEGPAVPVIPDFPLVALDVKVEAAQGPMFEVAAILP